MDIFPWYLIRSNTINTLKFKVFRTNTLHSAMKQIQKNKSLLSQFTTKEAIPFLETTFAQKQNPKLLNIKRKMFNFKPLPDDAVEDVEVQLFIKEYTARLSNWHNAIKEFDNQYQLIEKEQRRALQLLFQYEEVLQKPLPLVNKDFGHKFMPYITTPIEEHKAKIRKLDFQLSRLLARSVLKPSPFSSFTSISLQPNQNKKENPYYYTRVNFYLLQKIIDVLSRRENVKMYVEVRLASVTVLKESYVFDIQIDLNRGKIFNNKDAQVKISKHPILDLVIEEFRSKPTILYSELLYILSNEIPQATAKKFLDICLAKNILFPNATINEFTALPEDDFTNILMEYSRYDDLSENILHLYNEFDTTRIQFEQADFSIRFQLYEKMIEIVECICNKIGVTFEKNLLLYEDYIDDQTEGIPVHHLIEQHIKEDLNSFIHLAQLSNTFLGMKFEFAHRFHQQYGERKIPVLDQEVMQLYMDVISQYTKWTDVLAPVENLISEKARQIEYFKKEIYKVFKELKNDRIEVQLDAEKIEKLHHIYKQSFNVQTDSSTLLFQVQEDDVIINKLYAGKLRLFSRYFYLQPTIYSTDEFQTYVNAQFNRNSLEIAEGFGFNANHRSQLYTNRLVLPNSRGVKSNDTIELRDMYFQYDPEQDLVGLVNEEGEMMHDVNVIGSLVDYMLPYTIQILNMNYSPRFDIDYIKIWDSDKKDQLILDYIPRIRLGRLVISRRKWLISTAILQKRADESISKWAQKMITIFDEFDLPMEFFLKTYLVESDQIDFAKVKRSELKPQYLNLYSPLYIQDLAKILSNCEMIVIEEVYPEINSYHINKEYQVEIKGDVYV